MCVTLAVCALLLAAARAQHEPKDDGLDALLTPAHGEACGYASCMPIKPGWLNVHIVPHTHSELGHVYNFDQHFAGEEKPNVPTVMTMKNILDAVVTQLWANARRKFTLSDTAYLFHWWSKRHPAVHRMVYELIRQGRLMLVGGGLGISDEASTSYHAIIDHFTYSLRKLNATYRGCGRPLVAWAVDVYGHSREFSSLMAQMGYDALFINPISYDEELARMRRKALEFVWRGSDDLGAVTDIFTHSLFDGYWSPPGFCFSKLCSDPLLVTSTGLFANIDERVDKFIDSVVYRQAPNYETRNIMVIMGHRKAYFDADVWFDNIEKLISYTNWRVQLKGLNITLFYSNPACYLTAVHDENPELETKQDDFFPYVHDKDSYTVGMYTSRPNLKYLIREAHIYLQIVKQLQLTANMNETALVDEFNWIMGVVQDHSVATGVLRLSVKQYYVHKLNNAILHSVFDMSEGFRRFRESPWLLYFRCALNISSCYCTRFVKQSIQVYNPLGWPVSIPVRLPIQPYKNHYHVYDAKGAEVPSETIRLPEIIIAMEERIQSDYELVFIASNIPPLGFRSYYIEAQSYKSKRSIGNGEQIPTDEDRRANDEVDGRPVEETLDSKDTSTRRSSRKKNKNQIKVLGLDSKDKERSSLKGFVVPKEKNPRTSKTPRSRAKHPRKNSKVRNVIQAENDVKNEPEDTTDSELIMLPMLRDFLNKESLSDSAPLYSDEYFKEPATTTEFEPEITSKSESTPKEHRPFVSSSEPDLMIPLGTDNREPDIRIKITKLTTTEADIQVRDNTTDSDLGIPEKVTTSEPDIEVPIQVDIKVPIRVKPAKSRAWVPVQRSTTESASVKSTTDSDIRVPTREADITEPVKTLTKDIMVPISKKDTKRRRGKAKLQSATKKEVTRSTTTQTPVKTNSVRELNRIARTKSAPNSPTPTESLAIVPVRTASTESIPALSTYWHPTLSTVESVLVVPVQKSDAEQSTLPDEINPAETTTLREESTDDSSEEDVTEKEGKREIKEGENEDVEEESNEEEDTSSTTTESETESETEVETTELPTDNITTPLIETKVYKSYANDSDSLIDTDAIVSAEGNFGKAVFNVPGTGNEVPNTNTVVKKAKHKKVEASTEPAADSARRQAVTDNVISSSQRTTMKYIKLHRNKTTPATTPQPKNLGDKYFKVNDSGELFIGNKYVRVNLDKKKRVASVFLSNGIRVNLTIQMFHYVSDDPSKFDIRVVPRRDIKPPGAYIFRPIDPYIVKMEEEYEATVVKTSIVEEIQIMFNYWSSMVIRLYVGSPVIEVHWLVGPIPTADDLGREVFIRYATDLEHDGAFYTDSNGRQTVKRIRNKRATYEPSELDPITGNLYPVTSKIYIEDVAKNIRFSVFNDRSQAGGALVDGAIDLMVHRRLLTDDIGFGAYLNESDISGEGVKAGGIHYLYITKANKNRVFEKKFAKEIALAPRVLISNPLAYTDDMRRQFYDCNNEYSALNNRLPVGVHLLSFEKLSDDEMLVRLENYLEKVDVNNDGVKYVALRYMFKDIKIISLKETLLAANMFKEQWTPTQWRKKNKFYRRFNEYYGNGNGTYEENIMSVSDELGGRGIRLAPQQIRTFIVKYEYTGPHGPTADSPAGGKIKLNLI